MSFLSTRRQAWRSLGGLAPVENWRRLGKTATIRRTQIIAPLVNQIIEHPRIAVYHSLEEIDSRKKSLEDIYVSCWHMNDEESAAMWKLYTQTGQAIAIRSTIEHLKDSLPSQYVGDCLFLGVVSYINFNKEPMREPDVVTNRLFYKRRSFEHEAEIRAIVISKAGGPFAPNENGLDIKVDLDALIDDLYVGPNSPDWFFDLVKSMANKFGMNRKIVRTSLDDEALF
jgi:hypothetical protein